MYSIMHLASQFLRFKDFERALIVVLGGILSLCLSHPPMKGCCYLSHTPEQLMNHLESFWVASLMSIPQHWGEGIARCPYTGHSVKYGQYTRDALWVKDNLHCLHSVCKEWTAPRQSATNTDLLKKICSSSPSSLFPSGAVGFSAASKKILNLVF